MSDELLVPSSRELLGAIRRRWWLALAVALVVFSIAAAYLGGSETKYTATARVQLSTPADDGSERGDSFGDTELELLQSDDVLSEATKRLGEEPSIAVAQIGEGRIFSVTASGRRTSVADAANMYAEVFVELRRDTLTRLYAERAKAIEARSAQLEQARASSSDPGQLDRLDRRLEALGQELDETVVAGGQVEQMVTVLAPAESTSQEGDRSTFFLGAAVVLALLAGGLAPFAYELLRGTVNTAIDIHRLVPGLRVLATTTPAVGAPGTQASAALPLRLAIEADATGPSSVVAIALPEADATAGELVLETARQLATDASTVVVEAMATPRLAAALSIGEHPGLLDLLGGAVSAAEVVTTASAEDDLAVVPLGRGETTLLTRPGLRDVLTDLGKQYPYVIVLAPSVATPEGLAVASAAGRVVLTATAGRTKVSDLREMLAQLENVGVTVLGVVLEEVGRSDAGRIR